MRSKSFSQCRAVSPETSWVAVAGRNGELDLHCLRHSMITRLVESDYPEWLVQEQAR